MIQDVGNYDAILYNKYIYICFFLKLEEIPVKIMTSFVRHTY